MQTENIQVKRMVEGLCAYIIELEPLRPPLIMGLNPHALSTIFELLFKQRQKSYFVKHNPNLHQNIRKEMKFYRTDTEVNSKDMLLIFIYLITMLLSIVVVSAIVTVIYSLNLLYGSIFLVIISLPNLYLFLAWMFTRRRRFLGKKYDADIKMAVQELIDYGIELVEKNDLDPKDFPIKLRHNDYTGLVYEKKGKNNYVGFFRNEE